jgi:hypothetical protein
MSDSPASSIETLPPALYDAICFEPGARPRLERLRELFATDGRLAHVKPEGVEAMVVETFIARFVEQVRLGRLQSFHEREITREIRRFGNVAQVFSTYEARWRAGDSEPCARGINSIQLWFQDGRWHVVSLIWDDERPGNPIPPEHLGAFANRKS